MALPDGFTPDCLYDGYGEGVCFIVNDLTNRELIRRNFKFETPKLQENDNNKEAMIEDDSIFEGSTVFNNTMNSQGRMFEHEIPNFATKHIQKGSKDLTGETV
jgi:hypothetical protein